MNEEHFEQLKKKAKQRALESTFEGRIKDLETTCRRYDPEPDAMPDPKTRAWFAARILDAIQLVRYHLEQGQPKHAAAEAITVGALAMEAEARLNWKELKQLRGVLKGLRKAHESKAEKQRQLLAKVDELRAKDPDRYKYAKAVATKLVKDDYYGDRWGYYDAHVSPEEEAKAIDAMRKRIGRAEKARKD